MINNSVTRDVFAKRKQYGLKQFIASTIHCVMGDTIGIIVTCVNDMDIEYNLWDKKTRNNTVIKNIILQRYNIFW